MSKYFYLKNNFILEVALYLFAFGLSYVAAFYVRLEGVIPQQTWAVINNTILIIIVIRALSFVMFRVFHGQWRYCSILDVLAILKAITFSSLIIITLFYILFKFEGMPRSVFIIDWLIVLFMVSGIRFFRRLLKEILRNTLSTTKKVLVVGANEIGKSLINEMKSSWETGYNPVALVDDDPQKQNQVFYGVKVLGTRMSIPHIVSTRKIDEIIIANPNTSGKIVRETISLCRLSHIPFKIVSAANDPIEQRMLIDRIRKIDIQDLIGRKQIDIDYNEMCEFFAGRRILVTGAAGSIGSELCRQIAQYDLEKLITLDRSENGLFYLDRELSERFPELDYELALSDITDYSETNCYFSSFKPHIVFHAAAYKHVPMMERHPYQAIKTNILGTKNVLDISLAHEVEEFIMISTDKAVNATSYMGLTKRVAEDFVKLANQQGSTKCISVRFGNVIGSSGSVIRIFEEQISRGGPVTVTHPDVARYFMSIPEAVILVLQAASLGSGGETFLLKMGELVKIYDLARELILLAGYEPNKDIMINFTGLRPGEKIIEQLWEESENCSEEVMEHLYVIKNNMQQTRHNENFINELLVLAANNHAASNGFKDKLRALIYERDQLQEAKPL